MFNYMEMSSSIFFTYVKQHDSEKINMFESFFSAVVLTFLLKILSVGPA